MSISYSTLMDVAMEARPYPTQLLEGCETGLVLFAAAFLGHNDAIHMAEAGMRVWCVDIDQERLGEMWELYPDDWTFIHADAWKYAERYKKFIATPETYDVVSVDTFVGDAMERSLKSLDLWCSLAKKAVTVTVTAGAMYKVPDGWRAWHYKRAYSVYWLVLERL